MVRLNLSVGFCFFLFSSCFAAETNKQLTGDLSLEYSYYQSDYFSRTLATSHDLIYKSNQHETLFEGSVNNQSITMQGVNESISRFRYDTNIKWKYFFPETPYYSYVSPRFRHNDSGYFTSAQAIRIGGGRKIVVSENQFSLTLEVGSGIRYATLFDNSNIHEQLTTFSAKMLWEPLLNIGIKLNLTQEKSSIETYRTVNLEIKNKLTKNFSIKTSFSEKRTYPLDISLPNGELISSVGIAYEM